MTDTVPPEELNSRRRFVQINEEIHGLLHRLGTYMTELQELGADPTRMRDEIVAQLQAIQIGEDGSLSMPDAPLGGRSRIVSAMTAVFDRLFAEAPKLTSLEGNPDPKQKPALLCHILLRGNPQPLNGSLSITEEGALRMLSPAKVDGQPKLLESFFEVEDVLSVMVERDVKAEQSRIYTAS